MNKKGKIPHVFKKHGIKPTYAIAPEILKRYKQGYKKIEKTFEKEEDRKFSKLKIIPIQNPETPSKSQLNYIQRVYGFPKTYTPRDIYQIN